MKAKKNSKKINKKINKINNKITKQEKTKPKAKNTILPITNKINFRDAANSMNGYYYQRYYAIKLILENIRNQNIEYVIEEDYEDVDLIYIDESRDLYQLKYHKSKNSESLTYASGLFKVIRANWEKNNEINNIYFNVYSKNSNGFTNIKNLFENKKYYIISKYYLLLLYEKCKDFTFSLNINLSERKINQLYKKYRTDIKVFAEQDDYGDSDGEHRDLCIKRIKKITREEFEFFDNKISCENYFKKYSLNLSLSFDELIKNISDLIKDKFSYFFDDGQSKEFNIVKKNMIMYKIENILTEKMFNNIDRKIKLEYIFEEINKLIQCFRNQQDLLVECLNGIKQK